MTGSHTLLDQFTTDCRAALDALRQTQRPDDNDQALLYLIWWIVRRYVDLIPGLADPSLHPEDPIGAPRMELFAFLDKYTFAVVEPASTDPVTGIDLEMVGRVCELLSGTPEVTRSRAEGGIFYTPRAEIDLMSRLALADWLAGRIGHEHRAALNALVFDAGEREEATADAALAARGLWPAVDGLLRDVTVVDPACGSGAFLIGVFRLLDRLRARAANQLGQAERAMARRARIVACSLYGADTKAWAVEIARLRLRLACLTGLEKAANELSPAPRVRLADTLLDRDAFGERREFDIVIGNPPYVRQESIRDPRGSSVSSAPDRHAYKSSLATSVYVDWPLSFGHDPNLSRASRPLNLKSDLYVYFYFRGLSLVKPGGVLCFITSNAWLDVSYGRNLQEFLLMHGEVRWVIENAVQRSFTGADVNTAIVLLGPARDSAPAQPDAAFHDADRRLTRFLTFTVPFERAQSADLWTEIQSATARCTTSAYRVFPIVQADLRCARHSKSGRWGGLYLRAPDVFWTLLERCGDALVRLGDLAEVRFGVKTGANSFFYLDQGQADEWGIEPQFLAPFLFSFKEVPKYEVEPSALRRKIFVCRRSKSDLAARGCLGALRYIAAGEAQGFHRRPSVRDRLLWYALPEQKPADFVSNRFLGERFGFPWVGGDVLVCDVFFCGRFRDEPASIGAALLNSSVAYLSAEVNARKTYGIGVAYLYGPEINGVLLPKPELFDFGARMALADAFMHMRRRRIEKLSAEMNQPDRRALDEIVFDALGLTSGERDAVRRSLVDLVSSRLKKART